MVYYIRGPVWAHYHGHPDAYRCHGRNITWKKEVNSSNHFCKPTEAVVKLSWDLVVAEERGARKDGKCRGGQPVLGKADLSHLLLSSLP